MLCNARTTLTSAPVTLVTIVMLAGCGQLLGFNRAEGDGCYSDGDCNVGQSCAPTHQCIDNLDSSIFSLDACSQSQQGCSQPCRMDDGCPPGQSCIVTTPTGATCEIAVNAAMGDDAGATVDADADAGDHTLGNADVPQADTGAAPSTGDVGVAEASPGEGATSDAKPDDEGNADANGFCMPTVSPSTLVLFGGEGAMNFGDMWLWDGAAWSSVDAGDAASPPSRSSAATATVCGHAVLVGGTGARPSDGGSPLKGDAWLWDGSRWQPAPSAPPARFGAAAATLGSTLYLFGGQGSRGIDATESGLLAWDGGAWSTPLQSSSSGPPPRVYPVVVSVAGGVLVFGGEDDLADVLSDTWLLTDASWQLLDDGGADSGPALQAAGAASVGGGSVVMFGGLDENTTPLGDTWLWDGGAWSKAPMQRNGPPPRAYPVMGTLNGQVVLFGGSDATGVPLGDTWLWDGGSWVRGPDAGPPPRSNAAMTTY
jgi:hypothetical protein